LCVFRRPAFARLSVDTCFRNSGATRKANILQRSLLASLFKAKHHQAERIMSDNIYHHAMSSSSLLDLAPELRNMIYEFVFEPGTALRLEDSPSLLLVNRQIREEGTVLTHHQQHVDAMDSAIH
jgi:hypothetical protein